MSKVLRIPKAILDQNAGQSCSEREAAKFVGVGFGGPFQVEVSSALKYGILKRLAPGQVAVTDLARKIIRPQQTEDEIIGLREAVLQAPDFGDVYQHYRGENLPDPQFFRNALVDKFKIPEDKVSEFETIFLETIRDASLLDEHSGKRRILDVAHEASTNTSDDRIKKLGRQVSFKSSDTCFVMMPFANPVGAYYSAIYEPAIQKAGLTPIRADADIFGTGKIIDQIWQGINSSKVLVAELTNRNPNVFYELGLAHALNKPVVLVCSNESDVPFDLQHIRVIYYDVTDPFWGSKLIEKIAENILSALRNPEEAVFKAALQN
ncbi:nucleoside 2-deoxyribosyltransferase [Pseudomonas sp. PDM14]|uniref:nucleoside 2-deoxyribosyltransferase n=1 Tax=Pseudomonas sp. PDM14 TaxID=2769288 RepID=UPI001CE0F87B|nr:nucleoside 2-deoxyribosyltransferase [Pseudomonas sp. PDM14]